MDNQNHNHNIARIEDEDDEYWGFNPNNTILTDDDCVVCLESKSNKHRCDYCKGICCITCIRKMLKLERLSCKVSEFEIKCPCCRKIGVYRDTSNAFETMVGIPYIYEQWKLQKTDMLYTQHNDELIPILMRYTDWTNRSGDFIEDMERQSEHYGLMRIGIRDELDSDSDEDSIYINTDSDSDDDDDGYDGDGYWWDTDGLLYVTDSNGITYQLVDSGLEHELLSQSRILLESQNIVLDTIRNLTIQHYSDNSNDVGYTELEGTLAGFSRIEKIRVDMDKSNVTINLANMDHDKFLKITKFISEMLRD